MIKNHLLKGLFITGTDTGVGKTYVSELLLQALCSHGVKAIPRKPVESGCQPSPDGSLYPADGMALLKASGLTDLAAVTPYRFRAALSPPRAAALEGKELKLASLASACEVKEGFAVVEGAGGFLSPIADDGLNADLAMALRLPVIIITADRLGCINHCLLTCEAVERRGLEIMAVVLNSVTPAPDLNTMDNADELRRLLSYPVIEIPHQAGQQAIDELASMIIRSGV